MEGTSRGESYDLMEMVDGLLKYCSEEALTVKDRLVEMESVLNDCMVKSETGLKEHDEVIRFLKTRND